MPVGRRDRDPFRFRNLVIGSRPLAYWPLGDKGVNPGVWVDWTRSGTSGSRDLTTVGGTPVNPLLRGDRAALSQNFSGAQSGNVADATWQDVTTFSFMFHHIATSTGGSFGMLMGKGSSGTLAQNPYMIRYDGAGTQLALILGNNATSQTVNIGAAAAWHNGKLRQFIVTVDGSNVRVYVNGDLFATTAQTVTPYNGSGIFYLGGGIGGYSFLTGNVRMSNVALWGRVLTAGDARRLYTEAFS